MNTPPLVIGGIPLPFDTPQFLALVGIHVAAGLICVLSGLTAMLSRKSSGRHPAAGKTYFWSLCAVCTTAAIMSALRWEEDWPLFALGVLSSGSAFLGRAARWRHWRQETPVHIASMGLSYIALLTAFYVDNGKNLPLWRALPQIAFWALPGLIGVPLILRAMINNARTAGSRRM